MSEKLTNAAIALAALVVGASIVASILWGWFGVVAIITLVGVGLAALGAIVLRGYAYYVSIQSSRYDLLARRNYAEQSARGSHGHRPLRVGQSATGGSVGVEAQGVRSSSAFADLIRSNTIGEGRPMVAGYDSEGASITVKKIRTMGIGGVTGSGKTVTTLNTILSQIVFTGGNIRYLVVDPHMFGDTDESLIEMMDSLWEFFLTLEEIRPTVRPDNHAYLAQLDHMTRLAVSNPMEGKEPLLEWVKVLKFELDERIHGKKGDQWVVVIDEFSAVMQDKAVAKELAYVLEKLAEEARKFGITLILIGQVWKSTRTGGTEIRDTLPEFKAHRMPENWAKLVVPSDIAKKVARLATGDAILYIDGVDTQVTVPYTTEEDAVYVANTYHVPFNAPTVLIEEVQEPLEIEQPKSKRKSRANV